MNSNEVISKIIIRLVILYFTIFITSVLSVIETGMNIYREITIVVYLVLIVIFTMLLFIHKKKKL